jgi:NADPH:quinone reductase-like Zn-dependent oxidoreductase
VDGGPPERAEISLYRVAERINVKAIVYRNYGSPDVLELVDLEKPVPGDKEVLIQVRAASVNPLDWHFLRGTPYLLRLSAGLRTPKSTRLGVDVAGRVEAVGASVTRFQPGDEVFGGGRGAFAEYVCAPESALILKPDHVTFEQAASVRVAALTALQGLRDKGRLQPGQTVLINGAAGGVGTFAVQLAKWLGAEVTGVCSARNLELVRSLGADRVIDYTREDFTRGAQRYDLILECVGNVSFSAARRVLNPNGICAGVGASSGRWMIGDLLGTLAGVLSSRFRSRKLALVMTKPNQQDLTLLRDLLAAGTLIPVIDRRYTLSEVPAAIRYLELGHARGKVVIVVAEDKA